MVSVDGGQNDSCVADADALQAPHEPLNCQMGTPPTLIRLCMRLMEQLAFDPLHPVSTQGIGVPKWTWSQKWLS